MKFTFHVIDDNKVISRHTSFWNAQDAVKKHLQANKISNNYSILPIEFSSEEQYHQYMNYMNKEQKF